MHHIALDVFYKYNFTIDLLNLVNFDLTAGNNVIKSVV